MKNRRTLVSLLSGLTLTAVLVGGAGVAYAGTGYSSFSTTIGVGGTAAYTGSQTKTTSNAAGNFAPSFIGVGRTISARQYRNSDGAQGAERTGVAAGDNVTQPNSFSAGNGVRTQVAGNFTWPNSTQVDGSWRSN